MGKKIMAKTKLGASLFVCFLLFISLFSKTLQGTPIYPKAESTYLNDFARIINENDTIEIKNALFNFQKDFHFPVVLVTIDDLGGEEVHIYATKLANQWGIGEKEQDKGTLILFSREDRKVTLQLGRGNRDSIPTADREQIIKNMITYFKNGDYSTGLKEGTRQTLDRLKKWVEMGQPVKKAISKGLTNITPIWPEPKKARTRTWADTLGTLFFGVCYIAIGVSIWLIVIYIIFLMMVKDAETKYLRNGRLDHHHGKDNRDYPDSSGGDIINYFQPSSESPAQDWSSSGSSSGNSSWDTSSSSYSSGSDSGGSSGGGSFDGDGSSGSW